MGGGVSFSYWTAEEEQRNKLALEYQEFAKDFIINNMYYGIPVRCGKISHDPFSPLWIEIDPKVVEDTHLGKSTIERSLLETVPSAVAVHGDGSIKILFSTMEPNVEYMLNVTDLKSALQYEDPLATSSTPVFVPMPEPPTLFKAQKNSLKLIWKLPQPPGIAQQIELQYAMVNPEIYKLTQVYLEKLNELLSANVNMDFLLKSDERDVFRKIDANSHGLGPNPLVWSTLCTRAYYKFGFLSFTLDKLLPGDCYCFRLKFLNHRAWSPFSYPSRIFETLPAPPSEPSPPICGYVAATSVQLFWMPPFRDNGSPIKEYILRGKSAGGEFVELFRGQNTTYLANNLFPEFIYSFEVAAVNSAGVSVWSRSTSVTTPKAAEKRRPRDPDSFEWVMALQFRDAWRELWDPKTEQVFYFNTITGTRQLEIPEALQTDVSGNDTDEVKSYKGSSEGRGRRIETAAEAERRLEVEFRKKRYRLLRALHSSKEKNDPGDSKPIEIRRENVLQDGFRKFSIASALDLKKRAKFTFVGEPGIDSGGIGKEVFLLISRQSTLYTKNVRFWMKETDKKHGTLFFCPENEPGSLDHNAKVVARSVEKSDDKASNIATATTISEQTIAEMSKIKGQQFFKFLGRFLGKAIFDRQLIDMPLSKLLLKHMLGQNSNAILKSSNDATNSGVELKGPNSRLSPVKIEVDEGKHKTKAEKDSDVNREVPALAVLEDMKDLDAELYKSLFWMLNNNITDVIYEKFVVQVSDGTRCKDVALCPNGENKDVIESNKEEYVRLIAQWHTQYAVGTYLDPFLNAFHELISLKCLQESEIEPNELDLILNGKPTVDIEELRAYCIYQGSKVSSDKEDANKEVWGDNHEIVVWFWQALRDSSQEDVRVILCFFTGSARVPLDGYDPPLNITQGVDMDEEALPRSHTCFNQLVLPPYSTYERLREKLLFAAKETEGFSIS